MKTASSATSVPRLAILTRHSATMMLIAAAVWAAGTSAAHAVLTHRYSFTTDVSDSIGGANGTLAAATGTTPGVPTATVAGGTLNLNNPNFTPAAGFHNWLNLPANILPASGSATIEQWFTFTGSGFFTEAWAFSNSNNDANPPGANSGQYLLHAISAPQPPGNPGGGSHIAQALSGYAGSLTPPPGGETDAFGTTVGLGFAGGGYLDDGGTYMAATVIDGGAGTLSYYVFRVSDGLGGLQQTIPAVPLSSYSFTNAYLGRSPFLADNATSGAIDEFRIYNDAKSTNAIAADFARGPNNVPEPASLALAVVGPLGLLLVACRKRRSRR